jgi:hypothetical protein
VKKLKVTWQDGSWNRNGEQPIASAKLPEKTRVRHVGEDTLIFEVSLGYDKGTQILLVVPEQRLISAILAEDDNV